MADADVERGAMTPTDAADTADIWILSRKRSGDLNQMVQLAEAVGRPYAVKTVPRAADAHRRFRTACPELYAAPWPKIILSAERRVSALALSLKAASAGRAKAVSLNRPGMSSAAFDLVITAPHFRVDPAPNVLELPGPLHVLDRDGMQAAAVRLDHELRALLRPFTVALVGATSGVERLGGDEADALTAGLAERVRRSGGSLLVATSPRTSPEVVARLARGLGPADRLYPWSAGMAFNPYKGLLEVADEFVVTSDSASMAVEAALTGKPVYLFELPRRETLRGRALEAAHRWRGRGPGLSWLFDRGFAEVPADRRLLYAPWMARGIVRAFAPEAPTWTPARLESPVATAAAAVRRLLTQPG